MQYYSIDPKYFNFYNYFFHFRQIESIESIELSEWFKKSIENEEIKFYDYQEFNNISEIGSGGFSLVYTACWKNTRTKYAIKKFSKSFTTKDEVINEVCGWKTFLIGIISHIDSLFFSRLI